MSSVSSSGGSSNNDDQVRRTREDYKKREAELVKKHNQEMRKVAEANQIEVEKMKEQHEARINELQGRSKDGVTRRDAKYQKEIDEMRRLHTQQLERLMKENEQKLQTQRQTAKQEVKHANLGKEDRVQELHSKYTGSIAENEASMRAEVEKLRENQAKSVEKVKTNLNQKHAEDVERQKDYYDQRLVQMRNNLRTTRNSARDRITNQEVRHMNDKMRLQESTMDEIQRRDQTHSDIQKTQKEAFGETLEEIREKNRLVDEADRENSASQHSQLKRNVEERFMNRERRLEREISELKNNNARDRQKTKMMAQSEIEKWRDQYQDKFDALEKARIETLNVANKTNADDIKVVNKKSSDAIAANNRYMQSQVDIEVFKAKEALGQLENESALRTEYHRENADRRVATVRDESLNNEQRLRGKYSDNITVLREGYENEIRELRIAMLEERRALEANLKAEIQKQNVQGEREKQDIVSKYEKQIKDLNDQFVREKRLREQREKQLTEEVDRSKEREKDRLRAQYAEKNKQVVAQHSQEIRDVTRRHKEQIDNIMSNAKKA